MWIRFEMSKPITEVESLSKRYHLGAIGATTLRASLERRWERLRQRSRNGLASPAIDSANPQTGADSDSFLALRDVSFSVERGEVLGIIGKNGAGKSTLLKILSRITEPTSGRAVMRGKVASLLEVGTGFHPELSGRENIYLNGTILGMRRAEIDKRFDEIVAFAEVEKFIDTPVKRYSSGMYVRLAFAVAAHLQPEILIVDEVLAVGDAQFQKKCLGKMEDVASAGRTILFVSHNMTAVKSLCSRAVWLDKGEIVYRGQTHDVVSAYLRTASTNRLAQYWPDIESAPGNESVRLHGARLYKTDASNSDLTVSSPFCVEFDYWNLHAGARLNLSMIIHTQEGVCVFTSTTVDEPSWGGREFPSGLFKSTCAVPGYLLNDGTYRVTLLVVRDSSKVIYVHEEILVFDVCDSVEKRGDWFGKWAGVTRPDLQWRTSFADPLSPIKDGCCEAVCS